MDGRVSIYPSATDESVRVKASEREREFAKASPAQQPSLLTTTAIVM